MDQIIEFVGNNALLFIFFAAVVALIAVTEFRHFTRGYRDISPAEAVQLMNREDAVLLDVQSDAEIGQGRIKGARHMPMDVLKQRLKEMEKYRGRAVITYDRNGLRSPQACTLLRRNSFEKVYCLKGGLQAWQDANLPVVTK